jgi:hypothetical protein
MDAAVFIRSCAPAAPDAPKEVVHELPERLVRAIHGIKLLTGMKSDWDHADISGAGVALWAAVSPLQRKDPGAISARQMAIATLYFWIQKLPHLDGGVAPHKDFPLSSFLSERINDVWAVAPELLEANVHWQYLKVPHPTLEQGVMEGQSVADVLSLRGVVLDSDVLDANAAAALDRQFRSDRCIALARRQRHYPALERMASMGDDVARRVYATFSSEADLVGIAHDAAAPATPGPVIANGLPKSSSTKPHFTRSQANNAASARALLAGMAAAGVRGPNPQHGWASGLKAAPLDVKGEPVYGALTGLTAHLWDLASNGYDVSGYQKTVRDIGTIVGYGADESETKALITEFAGALAVSMSQATANKWPKMSFGQPITDPSLNRYVAVLIEKVGGESFFDGLMAYFADAGVDPAVGICHLTADDRDYGVAAKCLDVTLRETMPPGTSEAYAAMLRARMMADAIAARTVLTPVPESAGPSRRRKVGV